MNAITRWSLVAVTVIGLGVDAYTHFDLASLYSGSSTSISQATLFYIEGASAILAAIAVVIRQNFFTAAAALLVAGGGLALLLLYKFVNVGEIGPLPNMYEPIWYAEKSLCAWFEFVAVVGALGLLLAPRVLARGTSSPAAKPATV